MAARAAFQHEEAGARQRYLTFRAGGQLYALPSQQVREIVRPPTLARVPLAPKSLVGIGNLRGAILPVAELSILLDGPAAQSADARVIVLDTGEPLGLLVDEVDALESAGATSVDAGGYAAGGIVVGVLAAAGGGDAAKILDVDVIMSRAFPAVDRSARGDRGVPDRRQAGSLAIANDDELFIAFSAGGQEFALPLASIREVIPTPANITVLPQAEAALMGMIALRDLLVPLVSLHRLLGLTAAAQLTSGMTVIVQVGDAMAGFDVDAVRDILRVSSDAREPPPPLILARSQSDVKLEAVIKLDNGARLVGVLDAAQLFREDVMTRIQQPAAADPAALSGPTAPELAILVFLLGGQEYGLAISAVEEVARMPAQITRLPHAPAFLKGVTNFRGAVLPVIDQRLRFEGGDAAETDSVTRRLIVTRIDGSLAGFIVDGVSEVLRVPADALDAAPGVHGGVQVLEGVLNLADRNRMILLLDPAGLLSHAEKSQLDALGGAKERQSAVDQGARGG